MLQKKSIFINLNCLNYDKKKLLFRKKSDLDFTIFDIIFSGFLT